MPFSISIILSFFVYDGVVILMTEPFVLQRTVGLVVLLTILFVCLRFLLREWLTYEVISANVLDVSIQSRFFGRKFGKRTFSVMLMSPLSYRTWRVRQYGSAGYMESGITFLYADETETFAQGVSELEGWELVDQICAATGLHSTEEQASSPAVTHW